MKGVMFFTVVLFLSFPCLTLAGVEVPPEIKQVVPSYPGGTVVFAMNTGGGIQMRLEVADDPAKVIAFYKTNLTGQDWKLGMEMATEGGSMINLTKGKQTLSIMASTSEEKKTMVIITLASGK